MEIPVLWDLDPRNEWTSPTWELFRCCLLRTLLSYDVSGASPDVRPVPDLASGPPTISPDGLIWTFRLREGIHYAPPLQDVEVTSSDFVRALERTAAPYTPGDFSLASYLDLIDGWDEYATGMSSSIVGLQTPDTRTLRIVTTQPDSRLLYLLTLPLAAPIPPMPGDPGAAFGVATGLDRSKDPGDPGGYGRFLVASGPYMIEGAGAIDFWQPVQDRAPAAGFTPWSVRPDLTAKVYGSITLVRNPSWDPGDDPLRLALADRIEITGGDGSDLFDRMQTGSLDLVMDASPPQELLTRYLSDPALRPLVQRSPGASAVGLAAFNVAQPPFDDPAVREAVAYALDRSVFADAWREKAGWQVQVSNHFASDTFEASLLSSWQPFPGADGHGDLAAARAQLSRSRYASHGRCGDPVCRGVSVVVDGTFLSSAIPSVRRTLEALGIDADIRTDDPYVCGGEPERHVGLCIGQAWAPDYPSADGYLGAFFGSDGLATTHLGASPHDLERWGYAVTHVPSVDDEIDRCRRDTTASQAACWARLDQYLVSQLVPAIPLAFATELRLSSPRIGPFPWDPANLQPALERIAAPSGDGTAGT